MIALADQKSPLPKRLALGADAYANIRKALGDRMIELDRQQDIALAADFTEAELAQL